MTDTLSDVSDSVILYGIAETVEYVRRTLRGAAEARAIDVSALQDAATRLDGVLTVVGILKDRADNRTRPGAQDPHLAVVLAAAELHASGAMDLDEFQGVTALSTLAVQGVDDPTAEQVAERVSELRTAGAFVSSLPALRDH